MAKNKIKDSISAMCIPLAKLELSGDHHYSWPAIARLLIENAEKNLKEISDALQDKFGEIGIVHEDYDDRALYPWGKVVRISNGDG